MIFNFRRRENKIDLQEMAIRATMKEFHKNIDKDRKVVKEVNKKLSNGITLKLYIATGGHK